MRGRATGASLLGALITGAAVLAISAGPALAKQEGAKASELVGAWYVLVHFKDSSTRNFDATRWLDRAWTFKMKGSRLLWTDFPIVVVEDASGRFEARAGNPRSRVLAGWEPNSSQLAEIMAGPRVNTRGSTSKTLRGNDAKGWKSVGRTSVSSATMVGYKQEWSIRSADEMPEFRIEEMLGSATTENVEGKTVYTASELSESGDEIRGSFERDGIRKGTFRMFRTKDVRSLSSSEDERTPNEKFMDKAREDYLEQRQKQRQDQ